MMHQMADILASAQRSGVSPWKAHPYEMPDDLKAAVEETRRKIREAFEEKKVEPRAPGKRAR